MVEFAISAIIIIMLLVGIVDFGRAFFTSVALRDAAQEGAVYGSICPKDFNKIRDRAKAASNTPINLNSADIIVTCYYEDFGGSQTPCGSGTVVPGNYIKVTVSYPNFKLSMPFLGTILGSQTIPLSASVKDTILRNVTCH